jgi:hypothetical protein
MIVIMLLTINGRHIPIWKISYVVEDIFELSIILSSSISLMSRALGCTFILPNETNDITCSFLLAEKKKIKDINFLLRFRPDPQASC